MSHIYLPGQGPAGYFLVTALSRQDSLARATPVPAWTGRRAAGTLPPRGGKRRCSLTSVRQRPGQRAPAPQQVAAEAIAGATGDAGNLGAGQAFEVVQDDSDALRRRELRDHDCQRSGRPGPLRWLRSRGTHIARVRSAEREAHVLQSRARRTTIRHGPWCGWRGRWPQPGSTSRPRRQPVPSPTRTGTRGPWRRWRGRWPGPGTAGTRIGWQQPLAQLGDGRPRQGQYFYWTRLRSRS